MGFYGWDGPQRGQDRGRNIPRHYFGAAALGAFLMHRVLLDLNGLKANPLLGASDRELLDGQAGRLEVLKRGISAAGCGPFSPRARYASSSVQPAEFSCRKSDYDNSVTYRLRVTQYVLDMLAFLASSAIGCGRPMVLSMNAYGTVGADYAQFGEHHQNVFHYVGNVNFAAADRLHRFETAQILIQRAIIENAFLGLASRLKAIPNGSGGTLLNESLLVLFHESGAMTHHENGMSVATLGQAGGRLRTGNYVDCYDRTRRNPEHSVASNTLIPAEVKYMGIPYIHLLNTLCRAAGLLPEHYTIPGRRGYFNYQYALNYADSGTYPYESVIPGLLAG
jgi:hypothetical protein